MRVMVIAERGLNPLTRSTDGVEQLHIITQAQTSGLYANEWLGIWQKNMNGPKQDLANHLELSNISQLNGSFAC